MCPSSIMTTPTNTATATAATSSTTSTPAPITTFVDQRSASHCRAITCDLRVGVARPTQPGSRTFTAAHRIGKYGMPWLI